MNIKNTYLLLILISLLSGSCTDRTQAPKPYGALPTQAQLGWHEMEYFSLICYGLNTYTEQEWAYGDVDPQLFTPTDLNTDQWAETAQKAGMKGLILVAKHHDGFCLWPSKYTDYSVAATPWKDGKGDILGDLAESCKKYGLKLGVYLSPWDRNHSEYGRPEYVEYYYKQLAELLTEYGEVFEFWIDGANGGTGYYGGARENRTIDRQTYYGYDKIFDIVKENQPNAVIFSDVGPGCRWVGNESGIGSETNWNTINTEGKYPGYGDPAYHKKLGTGEKGAPNWTPAEVNTTLLWPKAWYYHTGHKPRSLNNLMELYYTSIGRGSPLNLGIAITPEGKIGKADSSALINFRKQLEVEFENNLAKKAQIKASDTRGNSKLFSVKNITDEDSKTYWASNDKVQTASFEIEFEEPTVFNRLLLQEYIAQGQRIHKFKLEIENNNKWQQVIDGTTIGYKRVLKFEDQKAKRIKVSIETDAPCLTLSGIELYNAPKQTKEPLILVDSKGTVSLKAEENHEIYYRIDQKEFQHYSKPLYMPLGGTIETYAINKTGEIKSEIVSGNLGTAKAKWRIKDINLGQNKYGLPENAIDCNPETYWIRETNNQEQPPHIVIDLGEEINITGFSYVPCKDGCDGIIHAYEFYTSSDGNYWGKPISKGEFSNIKNNPVAQVIKLPKSVNSRFIKLISKSVINNNNKISIAEIDIFTKQVSP